MEQESTIYKIEISQEGFENFGDDTLTQAKDMGESLKLDYVMTDFNWDEDNNRNLILTAKIRDDVLVDDALSEIEENQYIVVSELYSS